MSRTTKTNLVSLIEIKKACQFRKKTLKEHVRLCKASPTLRAENMIRLDEVESFMDWLKLQF